MVWFTTPATRTTTTSVCRQAVRGARARAGMERYAVGSAGRRQAGSRKVVPTAGSARQRWWQQQAYRSTIRRGRQAVVVRKAALR